MPRRKKGEARRQILKVLENDRSLRFTEIKERIKEEYDGPISDHVLSYNLKSLRKKGKIRKAGGEWGITESYLDTRTHEEVSKIIAKNPISTIGRAGIAPSHKFSKRGSERSEYLLEPRTWDVELDSIAKKHFSTDVWQILYGRNDEEREEILEIIARALWLGLLQRTESGKEPDLGSRVRTSNNLKALLNEMERIKKERENIWKIGKFFLEQPNEIPYEKSLHPAILAGLRTTIEEDESLKPPTITRQQIRLITASLVAIFRSAADATSETELETGEERLISVPERSPLEDLNEPIKCCPTLVQIAKNVLERIPSDPEENEKWLRGKEETLKDFLGEAGKIKFAFFCSVGWDSLDDQPPTFTVRRMVEEWRDTLQKGIGGLKKGDVENLLNNIDNAIYRLDSSSPLEPMPNQVPLARGITFKDIYDYYPGAEDVDWWEGWKEEAEEYMKKDLPRKAG